ncbi:MAG: protease SohB [Myxococcales bacterium]|nr:protease SohB [Myxococcales bacterium]
MPDVLWDTLAFAAKAFVVFATVLACAAAIFGRARAGRGRARSRVRVERVNERMGRAAEAVRRAGMDPRAARKHHKELARRERAAVSSARPSVYVLDFKGDLLATAVESLREEVSALALVVQPDDEVVVRLESPGGAAHAYGLAASQLARLRDRGIRLTACVDKVAASGGYMMAAVAERIVAAPFAILGSIGVAAPVPNLHRLLERHGVDYREMTAGEFKRTVSVFGEITEDGRRKFQEQLDETHGLFKDFVQRYRPALDVARVATGEHWHGTRALELGLADELATSDDYLLARLDRARIFEVRVERPRTLRGWLGRSLDLVRARLVGV